MKFADLKAGIAYAVKTNNQVGPGSNWGIDRVIVMDDTQGWSSRKSSYGFSGGRPVPSGSKARVAVAREHRYAKSVSWTPEAIPVSKIVSTWDEHERLLPVVADLKRKERERRAAAQRESKAATEELASRLSVVLGRNVASWDVDRPRRSDLLRLLDLAELGLGHKDGVDTEPEV